MKERDLIPITEQGFNNAIKDVLLRTPTKKATYENKRPTKQESNTKWKLEKRADIRI